MNRRDFLLFRTEAKRRVVELSCRRLYLRALELQATAAAHSAADDALTPSDGEPPAVFSSGSLQEMFDGINRDLKQAELLRVIDRQWLPPGDLQQQVDRLVAAHSARGGVVEIRAD